MRREIISIPSTENSGNFNYYSLKAHVKMALTMAERVPYISDTTE
jgi:hypothetical protein